jgi:riboflavin biosynthesis RibT protein
MGLLSFMPDEKDLKKLLQTKNLYETEDNWQLFLWKEDDDIVGLIGAVLDGDTVEIRHISVNPSYRDQGIGKSMVKALKQMYEGKKVVPNKYIVNFFHKCAENEDLS